MADSAHVPETLAGGFFSVGLAERDPEIAAAIGKEATRQQHQVELIALGILVRLGEHRLARRP